MKKLIFILLSFLFVLTLTQCGEKEDDIKPAAQKPAVINPNDTLVKFTLYSNRVPYIWKRKVKSVWVQDTIKTNNAVKYEPYDTKNFGYGYWVTMNLAGKAGDSLHIKGEYNGKMTQMASNKGTSAAYVLIDNLK